MAGKLTQKKEMIFWLLYASLLFMAIVWERVEAVSTGYEVAQAYNAIKQKSERNEHLKFALNEMKSPSRLELLAKNRLGMAIPEPDMIFTLEDAPARPAGGENMFAKLFARHTRKE